MARQVNDVRLKFFIFFRIGHMILKISGVCVPRLEFPLKSAFFLCVAGGLTAFLVVVCACVSSAPGVGHLWSELDETTDLRCEPWPDNEDMGSVSDVVFRRSTAGELIASGKGWDRNGRPALFESPVSGSSQTPSELTVYKNVAPPRLQVDEPMTESIRLADGAMVTVARLLPGKGGIHKLEWSLSGGGIKGKSSDSGVLNFKTDAAVESGAVLAVTGGFFVTAVTGDSLVGNAQIETAFFPWGSTNPAWTHTARLPHTHLGDPVLVPGEAAEKARLLVPKWVDRETTIGTYRLSPERIEAQGNHGIFPDISTIVASGLTTRGTAMMVRSRDKDNWRFRLCEMNW